MKTYETAEEIETIFAALRGVHRLPQQARIPSIVVGSFICLPIGGAFAMGAFRKISEGELGLGIVLAVVGIALVGWSQYMQWMILSTRYEFSSEAVSYSMIRKSNCWSLDRSAISRIELLKVQGQYALQIADREDEPHVVQLSPPMQSALKAAGVSPGE